MHVISSANTAGLSGAPCAVPTFDGWIMTVEDSIASGDPAAVAVEPVTTISDRAAGIVDARAARTAVSGASIANNFAACAMQCSDGELNAFSQSKEPAAQSFPSRLAVPIA
jgi:hypothetical protein